MVDDGKPMITEGRRPPRELFGVHRSRRAPRWVSWVGTGLVAVGLVIFLLDHHGDGLWGELSWRLPLQLGLTGLVVSAVGRRTTTTALDESGVHWSNGSRTDSVRWDELVDVRVSGGGALLRAVDGRTVRAAPLPRDVVEALQEAIRSGGPA